jgi:hypothetical protein
MNGIETEYIKDSKIDCSVCAKSYEQILIITLENNSQAINLCPDCFKKLMNELDPWYRQMMRGEEIRKYQNEKW